MTDNHIIMVIGDTVYSSVDWQQYNMYKATHYSVLHFVMRASILSSQNQTFVLYYPPPPIYHVYMIMYSMWIFLIIISRMHTSLSTTSSLQTQSCSLQLTSHCCTVLKGLNNLRSKGLLFDVTLVVQSQEFQAHRVVLASCSEYFR